MATKLALWSITLLPGQRFPIYIRNDFEVSNAALPEDIADPNGRSVVKVSYHPINPALLADSDSDSEIDSDDEISFTDEDEFELDEEEGFKEVKKAGEANGADEDEDEEDDEEMDDDEDEEEDDEDEDFFDVEPEVTNVICALTPGKIEQAQLNLTFTKGDAVMFEVTGKNAVHLMGNYIMQPEPYSDDESDYDSEDDDYSALYGDEDDEDITDDEEIASKITEIPEKTVKPKKAVPAAAAAAPVVAAAADKKRKADAIESPASKTAAAAAAATETLSKKQKKKLAQQAQNGAPAAAAAAAAPAAAPAKANKRTLASGLVIEDVKVGDGQAAKRGKKLGMRYIGKLTNGKQFDANTSGQPFSFILGRGEVIKGWDEGLEGMKVGGERKLTIPANLAYGKSKIPGIPANSTLNFEVKLVSIK